MSEDWRNELVTKGVAFDALANLDQYAEVGECLDAIKTLPPAQPKKMCIAEIKVDGDELQECVNRTMNKVLQQMEVDE